MSENGATPTHYDGFETMLIAGEWREGRAGKSRTDTNPYTGEALLEIPLADADDLDEAYRAASEAQRAWISMPPQEQRDTIERAAAILESPPPLRRALPGNRKRARRTGTTRSAPYRTSVSGASC